jgi:hypothetical protein
LGWRSQLKDVRSMEGLGHPAHLLFKLVDSIRINLEAMLLTEKCDDCIGILD